MKTICKVVIYFSLSFLFQGCGEDSIETDNSGEDNIKIYYTYQDTENQLVLDGDTIDMNLGDTLNIFVEITEDDAFSSVSVETYNLETEEAGDYEYLCIAEEAGIALITAYAKNSELADLTDEIYVNVASFSYLLLITQSPVFTIDVEDKALKAEIETELEEDYIVDFYNFYTLTCNSETEGNLQLVTLQNDTISGSFTSSDIFSFSDLTLSYNNTDYSFEIEASEESGYYLLKQNLTEVFIAKYPWDNINEVSISTTALVNKQD